MAISSWFHGKILICVWITAFWKSVATVFGAYEKGAIFSIFFSFWKNSQTKQGCCVKTNCPPEWWGINSKWMIQMTKKISKKFCCRKWNHFCHTFSNHIWYTLVNKSKNAFFTVTTRVSYPTQMDYYSQGMKCCDKSQNLSDSEPHFCEMWQFIWKTQSISSQW